MTTLAGGGHQGDPGQPASGMLATSNIPIPVVVPCVSVSVEAEEGAESISSSEAGAFSVPTVSVEADESSNLSLTWYAPTCASDITLEWIQFVMKQYWIEQNEGKKADKAPKVQHFKVNMAGSPEDETTPTRG